MKYLCNITNVIESYKSEHEGKEHVNNLDFHYNEEIYYFFRSFESKINFNLKSLIEKNETIYEFRRIFSQYNDFMNKIKEIHDKDNEDVEYSHEFKNCDIVITDPCYIEKFDENFDTYLNGDTIYGDWSCTVFDDLNKVLGRFCADSGRVCICDLNEIKDRDKFETWCDSYSHCATIIRNFNGIAYLIYEDVEYEYEGKKYKEKQCYIKGIGNINFTTKQTGF